MVDYSLFPGLSQSLPKFAKNLRFNSCPPACFVLIYPFGDAQENISSEPFANDISPFTITEVLYAFWPTKSFAAA